MNFKEKGKLKYYLWKYKFRYLFGISMLLFVDYMNLYIPQITGEITDGLTTFTMSLNDVFRLICLLIGVAVLLSVGRMLYRYFTFGTAHLIEKEVRNDMFEKLETLSQRFFNEHKTGDLMTHFTNDLEALNQSIGSAVISTFDAVVMTLMTIYRMVTYVDLRLTLLTLIPMSFIAVGGYFFGEIIERRFKAKQDAFAALSDQVQESISGERVIKAFVQEEKQAKKFDEYNKFAKQKNMGVVKMFATFMPAMDFVIGSAYMITIIYGGYLAITSQITLGRFVAFSQYIGMLIWPMIALGDSITAFSQGRAAIERIQNIFGEVPEIQDDAHPDQVETLSGAIELNNLSFQYGKDLIPALENVSVNIEKGETLAILGRTGAGKTTFVNLLARVYDATSGSITFDGHDIKKIPLHTLRSNIAYVPQDSFLFSDTIEKNIAFGKHNATHEEVVKVCEDACVHDNIIDFPEGYETVVGERGVTLSGGQKQRCAIARAFLKDSPILIMDDSLSAVDTDTEDRILENLKQTRAGKTTIMIAHRVSTVKNANHILVLDEGKAVEYGTFDELMAKGGIFKEMYDKQQLEKQLND